MNETLTHSDGSFTTQQLGRNLLFQYLSSRFPLKGSPFVLSKERYSEIFLGFNMVFQYNRTMNGITYLSGQCKHSSRPSIPDQQWVTSQGGRVYICIIMIQFMLNFHSHMVSVTMSRFSLKVMGRIHYTRIKWKFALSVIVQQISFKKKAV